MGDLQVGHPSLKSIQSLRQPLWNKWEQGVFITSTLLPLPMKDCRIEVLITISSSLSTLIN